MGVEHPLSSRAVDETKGEVAVYDGKLINALYTCTCGGATEDAEAMFEGNAVPYLRSTTCVMEAVQFIEREGPVRRLQVSSQPLSNVHDRAFQYHSWQVRTARQDLEARLNRYYPIGRLIDLVPRKLGASRRVIELAIIGEKSLVLVTGLSIRRVLNLRDNLFVIDREADEEGRPTHFIFSGRGWGHGVGLCQVGAFLMARNGSTYEEILKTYYHGIEIEKRPGY